MTINAKWRAGALLIAAVGLSNGVFAQEKAPENWFNLDYGTSKVYGMGTEKAYSELLKGKTATKVIVAVLDSGVEIDHEDLKGKIWVNTKEIAGNGKDDDGNGYTDDVNGWNFLGGKKGNVLHETLEMTRLYKELMGKYKDIKEKDVKDKKEYALWQKVSKAYDADLTEKTTQLEFIKAAVADDKKVFDLAHKKFGAAVLTKELVSTIDDKDEELGGKTKKKLVKILTAGTENDRVELLKKYMESAQDGIKYSLGLDNNIRQEMVGDDTNNSADRNYGNNEVEGPDASHGTHVSGIIAGNRTNNLGIKGVCENCVIMSVRCVPDGDERDKDVANAIRYAVDNGAQVINMSFGKAFPKDKKAVDDAVAYAQKKGVLLVHAAGNENTNKDMEMNYPNPYKADKIKTSARYKNWLDIGAMTWHSDEQLAAYFSNYGKTTVDVFAPGFDIYSTVPDGKYASFNGTSMAAPCTAGAAAMLLSYFPELTAEQLADIIKKSAKKVDLEVAVPGEEGKKVKFSELSITGGTVDVYEAVKLAEKTKGKRKIAKKA